MYGHDFSNHQPGAISFNWMALRLSETLSVAFGYMAFRLILISALHSFANERQNLGGTRLCGTKLLQLGVALLLICHLSDNHSWNLFGSLISQAREGQLKGGVSYVMTHDQQQQPQKRNQQQQQHCNDVEKPESEDLRRKAQLPLSYNAQSNSLSNVVSNWETIRCGIAHSQSPAHIVVVHLESKK